ncbi:MAG: hypothetical protein WBF47_27355 [Xanthobacteraceae bacterium]
MSRRQRTRRRQDHGIAEAARIAGLSYPVQREQHGAIISASVELNESGVPFPIVIVDSDGNRGNPWRGVDVLRNLRQRGAITQIEWIAAEHFRDNFATARLEPLKAADVSRPVVSGGTRTVESIHIERARNAVWRAIRGLGGLTSLRGSCMWHVIGEQRSLTEWSENQAHRQRRVTRNEASGILIDAIKTLSEQSA